MLIDEFVKRMSARFPTHLSTELNVVEFHKSCKDHLKKYQGEILGFVFEEFNVTINSRSHPVMAAILEMCKQKVHEANPKQAKTKTPANETIGRIKVEEFKKTLDYRKCVEQLISRMAISFIEKNGHFPDQDALNKMIKIRNTFMADMRARRDRPDERITGWGRTLYEVGCHAYMHDVRTLREMKGLNDVKLDYRQVTFDEHKNTDMDFPVPEQQEEQIFTDQKDFG